MRKVLLLGKLCSWGQSSHWDLLQIGKTPPGHTWWTGIPGTWEHTSISIYGYRYHVLTYLSGRSAQSHWQSSESHKSQTLWNKFHGEHVWKLKFNSTNNVYLFNFSPEIVIFCDELHPVTASSLVHEGGDIPEPAGDQLHHASLCCLPQQAGEVEHTGLEWNKTIITSLEIS